MIMKKCLLWGMGYIFREYIHLVKLHEVLNHFEVVGVTSDNVTYSEVYGYKYIAKKDLRLLEIDFVIVMSTGNAYFEILDEALNLGVSRESIITYSVLKECGFDIVRYMNLKANPPSIFSNNCWGGLTYHSLGLEFTSPLINMYESESDYLKFLKDPRKYINEELVLMRMGYNEEINISFPIVRCDDITLYFNHYDSFEKAVDCWTRRKMRINWNNLFVMMYTENIECAKEFAKLPYKKKICFVPFETSIDSLVYVELKERTVKTPFYQIVNGMASGVWPYYNVFDLIEKAQITKIVEMGC